MAIIRSPESGVFAKAERAPGTIFETNVTGQSCLNEFGEEQEMFPN